MPNFLPVWSRAVPSLSLGTNPTRGQSAVKLIQGEKKQAGDWPDARGRYSRMVGTRRTELWRCNSPWAWVSNLWPPTPLSGEKLQYRWDGGGALGGFSAKRRLPLTWSHSSLCFMAVANNYLHDLNGSPEQPYDIIMPISQARNEATETG